MKEALLDTDLLSFFLKGNPKVVATMDAYLGQHPTVNISIMSYYEIKNGLLFRDAKRQLSKFYQLIQISNILNIDLPVMDKAAEVYANLRKDGKTIGHVDVLIGCTALEAGLVVATNNTKHFSLIPGLEIVNWLE